MTRRRMRRRQNDAGVGLVEVVVALAVFSIIAAALGVASVSATRGDDVSKTTAAAAALVNDKIEQLRALDPSASPFPADLTAGNHSDPANPLTASGGSNGTYTRTWTVTENTPARGLAEVVVSLAWNTPTPRTLTGVTYVCTTAACS